ncbi:cell division FtsK/SpoIIIE [Gemmatirosa kalamazoonensis]|uniref:Cell division FtsK/SpoIIIE n=1 Tax=Gemmatirosa kalamazoonensis TaxID=861299 RepID=W0RNN5_9BACT|nr:DNA translocase FtsK [Gemmatirosa kalamazoonensis]AHG91068.1 cell division FtsK/SpoIIIE [Gemmatirosa kalamazoonensis]
MGAPALPGVPPGGRHDAPPPTRGTLPPELPRETALKRELSAVSLLIAACFLAGAVVARLLPPSIAHGAFGSFGDVVGGPLLAGFGWAGSLFVPIAPAVHALRLFGRLDKRSDRDWLLFLGGMVLLAPIVTALATHVGREESLAAGLWGGFVAFYATELFGAVGAWLVVLLALSVLTVTTLAWSPLRALIAGPPPPPLTYEEVLGPSLVDGADAAALPNGKKRRRRKDASEDLAVVLEPSPEEMPAVDPVLAMEAVAAAAPAAHPALDADAKGDRKKKRAKGDESLGAADRVQAEITATEHPPEGTMLERPPKQLLSAPPPKNPEVNRRELDAAGVKLMEALRTFKIEGQLVGRTVGPTVTQFEIEPAPGVKVRQIASLADDLALAMRAPSIRIVAPIPGKGAVGIEVPNASREMVAFREIVDSNEFEHAKAALPIALGKDLEGKPVIADLAKMPHLLIAGATGAGKSVCVNTIITSLIYRHTPRTLRFLMVDPKMVELSVYNDLPHMRHKVITDSKDAAALLKWALIEMEERYALLAANGCRNVQDFNHRVRDKVPLLKPKNPDVAFEDRTYTKGELPYIVVVIDEMADLMMTVQGEVETPIARLAQKARAIGIHLIIATQRPSVNVITGLIKANFPSRIAFRVASGVDSKTILDGVGAESLLGNGDMLFIPPGKSEPARLQGAFLSSEDTEALMHWYRDQKAGTSAEARDLAAAVDAVLEEEDILETVKKREALLNGKDGDDFDDESDEKRDALFREAAELFVHQREASTSLLQRRFEVGYGRAARIIDQLEAAGVLGGKNGSKPREVLMGLDELEMKFGPKA